MPYHVTSFEDGHTHASTHARTHMHTHTHTHTHTHIQTHAHTHINIQMSAQKPFKETRQQLPCSWFKNLTTTIWNYAVL